MAKDAKTWMDRNRWDALVRGEECPLCREYQSGAIECEKGYLIAELKFSRLRLSRNQFPSGYCVLICKKHVREPYHLPKEEQDLFFSDLMTCMQALEFVFAPAKMNIGIYGNLVPHLHAHIQPRIYGDPAPGRPIIPGEREIWLTDREYEERVGLIRDALKKIKV